MPIVSLTTAAPARKKIFFEHSLVSKWRSAHWPHLRKLIRLGLGRGVRVNISNGHRLEVLPCVSFTGSVFMEVAPFGLDFMGGNGGMAGGQRGSKRGFKTKKFRFGKFAIPGAGSCQAVSRQTLGDN